MLQYNRSTHVNEGMEHRTQTVTLTTRTQSKKKKTRSVSLIKMIAKLERTSRYTLQKERTTAKANRDLDIFYWPNERSIFFCP